MIIESADFEDQQFIPSRYTCEGKDVSPPLRFLQLPQGVKSFVLMMDDPDVPHGTFNHWIVWNIPPQLVELSDKAPKFQHAASPPQQGITHFHKTYYKGPCPLAGPHHHYHFKLYALDDVLTLSEGANKQEVETAMKKHEILDRAELVALYQHK